MSISTEVKYVITIKNIFKQKNFMKCNIYVYKNPAPMLKPMSTFGHREKN